MELARLELNRTCFERAVILPTMLVTHEGLVRVSFVDPNNVTSRTKLDSIVSPVVNGCQYVLWSWYCKQIERGPALKYSEYNSYKIKRSYPEIL